MTLVETGLLASLLISLIALVFALISLRRVRQQGLQARGRLIGAVQVARLAEDRDGARHQEQPDGQGHHQLDEAQADAAWQAFGAACDGLLDLLPVQATDYSTAAQMCRMAQAGLRAGDALHLAVALRRGRPSSADLTLAIGTINAWNRFGIGFALQPE